MQKQHYEGDERRTIEPPGWHLDKKVPITLILVLLMQAVAGILAVADIKKDVEVLKADAATLHTWDNRLALDAKEDRQTVRDAIAALTAKIDRLIERSK